VSNGKNMFLIVEEKGLFRRSLPLAAGQPRTLRIGREPSGTDMAIPHRAVSRQHAQFEWDGAGQLLVRDCRSTNGVWIDGKRIDDACTVTDGSSVSFGASSEWRIVFSSRQHSGAGASPAVLAGKSTLVYGRGADCDVRIDSPVVSRQHAKLTRLGDGRCELRDLSSTNGTFVNGIRLVAPRVLSAGDRVTIGKSVFVADGHGLQPGRQETDAALVLSNVTTVRSGRRILNDISLVIPERSFVAIMGPSGCGKSTLLKAMNGSEPATSGTVKLNGLDLYAEYDSLKPQIGYVPQEDIVHGGLSVHDALYYAARLRLPEDLERFEIERRIDSVMGQLHINAIRNSLVRTISGGERKRVSIAVELLSDPSVLFLDEPTSPLDPQTIEEFLVILRELTEHGVTVIMVTHKPDDLSYADRIVFLASRGYLAWHGPATQREFLEYFRVANVVQVYARLFKEDGATLAEAFRRHARDAGKAEAGGGHGLVKKKRSTGIAAQTVWLTLRQLRIRINDRKNTAILLAQAPIIALLTILVFDQRSMSALFLTVISAIWFGCNNAVREIVSEWPIYRRERMFNLHLTSYLASKLVPNIMLAAVQIGIFLAIVAGHLGLVNPLETYLALLLAACSSILTGLFVSALFDSPDKAMAVLPIVLIPQIVFSGVIAPLKSSLLEGFGCMMISRWSVNLVVNVQESVMVQAGPAGALFEPWPSGKVVLDAFGRDNPDGDLVKGLLVISAVMLVALVIVLRRKDSL